MFVRTLGAGGARGSISHLGEVIPDVPLVLTISVKCKRVQSSRNKALAAGGLAMPEGGGKEALLPNQRWIPVWSLHIFLPPPSLLAFVER